MYFKLTKSEVVNTLHNYDAILERVSQVAKEIGFLTSTYNMIDYEETGFGTDYVIVWAYNSSDVQDSICGIFPIDFLFEPEEKHKNWYVTQQERLKEEYERVQKQQEKELRELERKNSS